MRWFQKSELSSDWMVIRKIIRTMKRQIKSVKRSTRYKDRILIKLYDGELIKTSEEFFLKNSLKVDDFIDQNQDIHEYITYNPERVSYYYCFS